MIEEPLQFGEGGRLFGVLTRPEDEAGDATVFVFLNAGLLHRAGPHRLHVRLARRLAAQGKYSLRIDLGGLGDSIAPPGVTYPESVAVDFADVLEFLNMEMSAPDLVLVGLCAGADNAIRLAPDNPQVKGLVLMDPVCDKDDGFEARKSTFAKRALATKAATPSRYVPAIKRRLESLTGQDGGDDEGETKSTADSLDLRDIPTPEQTRQAFEQVRERQGRVLSVFTSYALRYYNEHGQMARVLGVNGYDEFATEIFWPQMRHTYPLETHRLKLMDAIEKWATG